MTELTLDEAKILIEGCSAVVVNEMGVTCINLCYSNDPNDEFAHVRLDAADEGYVWEYSFYPEDNQVVEVSGSLMWLKARDESEPIELMLLQPMRLD